MLKPPNWLPGAVYCPDWLTGTVSFKVVGWFSVSLKLFAVLRVCLSVVSGVQYSQKPATGSWISQGHYRLGVFPPYLPISKSTLRILLAVSVTCI